MVSNFRIISNINLLKDSSPIITIYFYNDGYLYKYITKLIYNVMNILVEFKNEKNI